MKKKWAKPGVPSTIRWSGLLKVEDIVLKRSRYGDIYAVLYTSAGMNVCAPEREAAKLCLYEPYAMRGVIKQFLGGQYLRLEQADLFESKEYRHLIL